MLAGFYDFFIGAAMLAIIAMFIVALFRPNKEKRADKKRQEFRKDWARTHCPNCGKRSKCGQPHPWPCRWYNVPEEDDDA